MDMKLTRYAFQDDGIFSTLTNASNSKILFRTLEHSYDNKPKLPDGVYKCVRGIHQLHSGPPFEAFEVTGVIGHAGILFHVGNFNKDSEGCILLGTGTAQSRQGEMVTDSKTAFSEFMQMQAGVNEFTLTVVS